MEKKSSRYWKGIMGSTGIVIVLNLATLSRSFCDLYVEYIFPVWVATYGRFSGLFPFSLGECLIIVGIVLVAIAILCGILLIPFGKSKNYKTNVIKYYKVCLAILVAVALMLTLNFNILYRCSPMEVNSAARKQSYSLLELESLRNYLIKQSNQLAEQIERDEKGQAVYSGDMQQETRNAMLKLAEENSRLSGYYPRAKPIHCSRLMSMTGIAGVYFAFSLEANYNNEMYATVYPETICHEYAHLKGYIQEDEANFIGYLACMKSDNVFFQYSGYLGALDYVEAAYMESADDERYDKQIQLNELAYGDYSVWLNEETREKIYYAEDNTAAVAENLTQVRETVHDASLKLYGVEDGLASYDRVTELLLQYYEGKLY